MWPWQCNVIQKHGAIVSILSKRMRTDVSASMRERYGLGACFVDVAGRNIDAAEDWESGSRIRRKRSAALQESINLGEPSLYMPLPGLTAWIVGIEDQRMVQGGATCGPVIAESTLAGGRNARAAVEREVVEALAGNGLDDAAACRFAESVRVWTDEQIAEAAEHLQQTFDQISGWTPELMRENRLRCLQQEQITQAIDDQRKHGRPALYAFEKERVLLANIRAGDRNAARCILNEMLATIYMSSPQLVVLRARAVELMSCLTRAAIEDNPLLEPLIERNHAWTERLVRSESFEDLSHVLMDALDDFIDDIYLHGVNRTNTRVRRALDYISAHFDSQISLASIADEVGLSRYRLAHLVKEFTGRTVSQIIQEVRINHAQQLLMRTNRNCAEIAADVGFSDQSSFTKYFKRLTGTTPTRFRRSASARR